MKKILSKIFILLLVLSLGFTFVSCKNEEKPVDNEPKENEPVVKEKELVISFKDKMIEGEKQTFEVLCDEKKVSSFEVFIDKNDLAKYENGELVATSKGIINVTIATTVDGTKLNKTITITIEEKEQPKEDELVVDISDTLYASQTYSFVVKTKEGVEITDFEMESSDEDVIECYPEDNELSTLSTGQVVITIKAVINNVTYEKEITVTVLEAFTLEVRISDVITTEKAVSYEVYVMPDNVKLTTFNVDSGDKKVFTVTTDEVTPVGIGKALIIISGTYKGAKVSISKSITVKEYVADYIDSNIDSFMIVNNSLKVNAKILPSNTEVSSLVITSSDNNIIEVNNNTLYAKSIGNAKITVKANEIVKEYEISVINVESIEINISNEISLHEVVYFEVIAKPSNTVINQSSLNIKCDSTNNNLLVNDHAAFGNNSGSAEVYVTLSYYKNSGDTALSTLSAKSEVAVIEPVVNVERITISAPNAILVGSTFDLPLKIYPENANANILVSSSDNDVVSVEGTKITAKSAGVCNIFAQDVTTTISSSATIKVIEKKDVVEVSDGLYNNAPITARYREESIKYYYELMCGVKETTYIGSTSTELDGDVDGYSGITGSIVHNEYYLQNVHVLEVPSRKDVVVIPWANLTGHKWSLSTVKGLIINFEEHNPGYKVIAAVNGDFFDINANKNLPYSTTGENVSNGEFYKVSNGFSHIGGTIGFTNDGSSLSLVAGANTSPKYSDYFVIDIYDENDNIIKTEHCYSYADNPNATSVIYYGVYDDTKTYNKVTTPDNAFIIENAELALPSDYSDFYGKGIITKIGNKDLEIGDFAISTSDASLQEYLKVGAKVRCQRVFVGEFAGVTSATGYNGVIFDKDGIFDFSANGNLSNRAPRTVIGMKEDGTLVMMVVDGRQGNKDMYGCDGYELTAIMRAYGCIKAYNVDGGGSSTIVVRTENGLEVLNSPSDGHERSDGNCILICTVDPCYVTSQENIKIDSATILVSTENEEYKDLNAYIQIDSSAPLKVHNGKVELTNLVHNNTYSYRVYYEKDGELIPTLTVGSFTTSKAKFKFLGLVVEEKDDKFIFYAYSQDPDKAGNVHEMIVMLNGNKIYLKNGTAEASKAIYGKEIEKLGYEYWFNGDNGREIVINEDGQYFYKK